MLELVQGDLVGMGSPCISGGQAADPELGGLLATAGCLLGAPGQCQHPLDAVEQSERETQNHAVCLISDS